MLSRRFLVAGCGYVGTALGLRLAADGHTVWGLRRSADALPAPIRPLAADLLDPATLADLPAPLDAVFYTASAGERGEAAYRAAYVDGLRNVLAAVDGGDGPRPRVVFTSSTGVYGQSDGEWVDETSPTEPARPTGRILLEAERLLLDSDFDGVVARLGGIYGPGRTRIIRRVREREAVCPAGPPIHSNRIHRDDAAGALAHLATLDSPEHVYLVVDRDPAELCTVYRWLADRLGLPEPPTEDDPGAARARRRRSNKRCSSARLTRSGYRFEYPTFREGYAALLAES